MPDAEDRQEIQLAVGGVVRRLDRFLAVADLRPARRCRHDRALDGIAVIDAQPSIQTGRDRDGLRGAAIDAGPSRQANPVHAGDCVAAMRRLRRGKEGVGSWSLRQEQWRPAQN
jgi:hypothetical protein